MNTYRSRLVKKKVSTPDLDFIPVEDAIAGRLQPIRMPMPVRVRAQRLDDEVEGPAEQPAPVENEAADQDEVEREILDRVDPRNRHLVNTMKRVARREAEAILRQRYPGGRMRPAWEMRETYHDRLALVVRGFGN